MCINSKLKSFVSCAATNRSRWFDIPKPPQPHASSWVESLRIVECSVERDSRFDTTYDQRKIISVNGSSYHLWFCKCCTTAIELEKESFELENGHELR